MKDLCRKHGFSEAGYYLWRSKFGGMDVSDAKRLKALEAENAAERCSRTRSRARRSVTLRFDGSIANGPLQTGAPGETRTPDPQVRSLMTAERLFLSTSVR